SARSRGRQGSAAWVRGDFGLVELERTEGWGGVLVLLGLLHGLFELLREDVLLALRLLHLLRELLVGLVPRPPDLAEGLIERLLGSLLRALLGEDRPGRGVQDEA